jgi:hypothetical protein
MAKKVKKWIQSANLQEGTLTRKAQAAGKTIIEFCNQPGLSAKSRRQCNLAKTFRRMAKD